MLVIIGELAVSVVKAILGFITQKVNPEHLLTHIQQEYIWTLKYHQPPQTLGFV